ncbi:MAG TPA: family 10 glycosylhydrolase [Micromonosporaceae bacterium]
MLKYDIDTVHFDDYFYPYPSGSHPVPDDETFAKYNRGFTDKADWRRDNVNLLNWCSTVNGAPPMDPAKYEPDHSRLARQ